jgi:2-amino-4-hydroxy-6-hydroxymethyldihydropteridine diphosphokinase
MIKPQQETSCYLSLGGNIGDPSIVIEDALQALCANSQIRVLTRSPFYQTPPWGKTDQADFINACATIKTTLPPQDLLSACLEVETNMGRVRGDKWGPRVIDIDILTYGDETISDKNLTIPHPYMSERAFVLVPLHDIAPDFTLNGKTISALLDSLDKGGIQRLDPRLPKPAA